MSTRSIVFAGAASLALMVAGLVVQDTSAVVGGLLSALAAAVLIAVKTQDTEHAMASVLFDTAPEPARVPVRRPVDGWQTVA